MQQWSSRYQSHWQVEAQNFTLWGKLVNMRANVDDVDNDEPWCARHHIAVRAWIANIPRTWRSSRVFWTFKRSILGERLEKGRNFPSEYQPGLLSPVWHRSSWPKQGSRKVLPLCNFWDDVWKSLHHVPGAPGHIVTRRDVPYWLIWSLRVYSGPAQSLALRSWKVFAIFYRRQWGKYDDSDLAVDDDGYS